MTNNWDPASNMPDAVAAVRLLSPQVIAARDAVEQLRQLPPAFSDALAEAGFYRMYLPRSMGGSELPPFMVFEAIEALSKADGAVGWTLMNANVVALGAGWLEPGAGRKMFGQPCTLRGAGSLRPQGRAWPVTGGYRVSGQWNFASGVRNANWLFCPCQIMDGERPRVTPVGTPAARTMWIPASDAAIIDTWSVMGMRGTGSNDFRIDDLFVPESHSVSLTEPSVEPGPLYRPRLFMALAHVLFAGNALGIARGAIESLVNLAQREATTMSATLLRDRPGVQASVARAEAMVNAARCYVVAMLTRLWTAACANADDPAEEIAQLRLAIPNAIHESVRAVDLVLHTAGTNAIYTANPLERHFRDIHVAVQHYAAFPIHYESAGKILLGLRPTEPGW